MDAVGVRVQQEMQSFASVAGQSACNPDSLQPWTLDSGECLGIRDAR